METVERKQTQNAVINLNGFQIKYSLLHSDNGLYGIACSCKRSGRVLSDYVNTSLFSVQSLAEQAFRILVENEKAVLEMDYQDMSIYWVYGDQEDAPAIGTDESQGDAAYPGADVVKIVNLRGDETTVYKLADGTYMDRMERRFTYNGTDIWTDENGVEWNEAAKD